MSEGWQVSKLKVEISYIDNIPVINAKGECDLITSKKLRQAVDNLIGAGHYNIIFDFREMTYIDSSGFRALLDTRNKIEQKNGEIVLVCLTAPVERVFNLLRLDELISRTETVEDALEYLSRSKRT